MNTFFMAISEEQVRKVPGLIGTLYNLYDLRSSFSLSATRCEEEDEPIYIAHQRFNKGYFISLLVRPPRDIKRTQSQEIRPKVMALRMLTKKYM